MDNGKPIQLWKSAQVTVTINNQSGGSIGYDETGSSTTGGSYSISNSKIDDGQTLEAFVGEGSSSPAGGGGQVTYNLPSGQDNLVILYNTDNSSDYCYCIPLLQSSSTDYVGSDTYYCVVDTAIASGTTSLSTTITIYEV